MLYDKAYNINETYTILLYMELLYIDINLYKYSVS